MPPRKFHVTDTELAVLQLLWDDGPATTRDLCSKLYPDGGTAQYYTVQKLLERLESRRCVKRKRSRPAHVFTAAIDRDRLVKERLRDLSDSLCGGAVLPMLSGLIALRRWTPTEQQKLQNLVEQFGSDSTASE